MDAVSAGQGESALQFNTSASFKIIGYLTCFPYLIGTDNGSHKKEDDEMKKLALFFVSAAVAAALAGCTGGQETAGTTAETASETTVEAVAETTVEAAAEALEETTAGQAQAVNEESGAEETSPGAEEKEKNYDTGDASMDNTRNQDDIGENELLVVSFGTSYNDSRRLTIGAIEEDIEKAFPDYDVRRGFTSQMIIDHVKSRDNVVIDNVGEALERAADNGVKRLVIQPTHLMNGLEYTDLVNEIAEYSDAFEKVAVGKPLLTSEEDFRAVIKVITEATAGYDDGETAICFMGHGTEADSNQVYAKMQEMLAGAGYENYYIGTVEAAPTLEDVLEAVQKGGYKKVVLEPLMIVAGDHASNDMAGDEEGSWKTAFEGEGYEVTCLVRGLGELEGIRQIFVEHAREAVDSIN